MVNNTEHWMPIQQSFIGDKLTVVREIHWRDNGRVVIIHTRKQLTYSKFTPARYGEQS